MVQATGPADQARKATKYHHIADLLRAQIRAGALRAGDRLPSYSQMRTQHHAQQATVDRAYGVLEQEGVIVRRPRSGIFVAERRVPPHPRIGVAGLGSVLIDRPAPYWLELMTGVRAVATQHEAHIELLSDRIAGDAWSQVDGLLTSDSDPQRARGWSERRIPCVSLLVPTAEVTCVVADDETAAGDLTRHLLYLGHRRIAYLTMLQSGQDAAGNPICARRVAGYRAALAEAGIALEPSWIHPMDEADHSDGFIGRGQRDMADWLSSGFMATGCTALLAQNDETAIGAIAALEAAGILVPERISVVGFDGTTMSMLCTPRLTTAVVPLADIGRRATELLLDAIAHPSRGQQCIVCPAPVRVRASSAPVASQPAARGRTRRTGRRA